VDVSGELDHAISEPITASPHFDNPLPSFYMTLSHSNPSVPSPGSERKFRRTFGEVMTEFCQVCGVNNEEGTGVGSSDRG
jgi:hypothetical protein